MKILLIFLSFILFTSCSLNNKEPESSIINQEDTKNPLQEKDGDIIINTHSLEK